MYWTQVSPSSHSLTHARTCATITPLTLGVNENSALEDAKYSVWDTECYRGIKPMAEGHPKPRIGSEEDTSNIASPLV